MSGGLIQFIGWFFLKVMPVAMLTCGVRWSRTLCEHWAGQSALVIAWWYTPSVCYTVGYVYLWGNRLLQQTCDFNDTFSSQWGPCFVLVSHLMLLLIYLSAIQEVSIYFKST